MTVTLDLPDELHQAAAALAERGGVPLNGFLTQAVTAALVGASVREARGGGDGLNYLRARAAEADRDAALAVLDAVPHADPDPHDRIPPDLLELRDRMIADRDRAAAA